MTSLSEHQLLFSLLAMAILLVASRGFGEVARRIGLPEVLGALFAGFLLGPSVFGALLPNIYQQLFLSPSVGTVLSALSWLGAILLLLLAGVEVDLTILRKEARPGALGAAFAIVPSLVAGSLFAIMVLHRSPPGGFFLGIVMSVTAVSVLAKILMERGTMRRSYAQIVLAAGVTSEVLVWLFVSVVSSFHGQSPLLGGLRSAAFAIAFFVLMMTVGKRFTFWSMRRVRDHALIGKGQLTLVMVLMLLSAAATHALGLHPLLGAFVFGVLLSQAPRFTEALLDPIEGMTTAIFAPIFFALAGMRVDILKLGSISAIGTMLLLFVIATAVKVGFSSIGARLGGQRGWESLLVGVGLNLKGGTDVIVAVIGTELGLLSIRAYTMYAVVAMLTVLFSPPVVSWLERRTPPTEEEQGRLESEEAARRSYTPRIERVMVPVEKRLLPTLAASVVERIAASKHEQGQLFDITEVAIEDGSNNADATAEVSGRLEEAANLDKVQVTATRIQEDGALERILEASTNYDLIAIGARPPRAASTLTLGELQDQLIDNAQADVLIAINHDSDNFDCHSVNRILVPTNGLEYSMDAGDIAGALAEACNAQMSIFHVMRSHADQTVDPGGEEDASPIAAPLMEELAFRVRRLGIQVDRQVVIANEPDEAILRELESGQFDLIVLGGIDRGADQRLYLGHTIQSILTRTTTPAILLVSHT